MEYLFDETGIKLSIKNVNHEHVKLTSVNCPEISGIYKKEFIEDAIDRGILRRGRHENTD